MKNKKKKFKIYIFKIQMEIINKQNKYNKYKIKKEKIKINYYNKQKNKKCN